jgi:hypothetical protein
VAAAKKTKGKKRRIVVRLARSRMRMRRFGSPEERAWRLYLHDFDTLLHELVRNTALADLDPKAIIAKCEAFADAYTAMKDRRRPPSVPNDDPRF